ncbi:MAG: cell division topological specificity factor MinE [Firmicutes bacterium]|nr:cell division topological specificity factor MinE [Bacillota bacterium]MCL5039417.1 cell division topological specificity factor MinE [Bacillota bacterium]
MLDLLNKVFPKDNRSKDIAKERLRLVLVHDRASVAPQFLEHLKGDLIEVISRYMEIDDKGTEINLTSGEESVALVASIPIKRMKRHAGTW